MTSRNPNIRQCPINRANVLSALTTTQHLSALAFGGFLIVHLSAPSVAVVAPPGSAKEWGSKAMILGRVAYQSVLTEPILVYGSAALHLVSSLAKRGVLLLWPSKTSTISPADDDEAEGTTGALSSTKSSSWSRPSPQTLSGILLLPFLTHHVLLNRIYPKSSSPPISSLSPSELSYDYVAHGLVAYPILSTLGFGGLILAGAFHTAKGTDIIARRMRVRKMAKRAREGKVHVTQVDAATTTTKTKDGEALQSKSEGRRKAKGASAVAVALGGSAWFAVALLRIGAEHAEQGGGLGASAGSGKDKALRAVGGWMYKRYEASYQLLWPYSEAWAR